MTYVQKTRAFNVDEIDARFPSLFAGDTHVPQIEVPKIRKQRISRSPMKVHKEEDKFLKTAIE